MAGDPKETAAGADAPSAQEALVHRTDAGLAGLILAAVAALFFVTTTFEVVPELLAQSVGPAFFPRLLLILIAGLALGLPIEHRFLAGGRAGLDRDRRAPIRAITWASAGLLCLIVGFMDAIGTLLTLVAVCGVLPVLWGERRVAVIVPYVVVFPALITVVFNKLLNVHFEPGLLGALVN